MTDILLSRRKLGVVGVPVSKGQRRDGTELGPDALKEGGLIAKLKNLGLDVTDYGNVNLGIFDQDTQAIVKNPRSVAYGTLETANKVEQALRENGTCMAIGGDHSMAIGTIIGHARVNPDLVVLWVDAHADINTPLTSESGNIHGMPLSFLAHELDRYVPSIPGWDEVNPCINLDKIAWIGLRDVDPGETKIFDFFHLNAYSMQEVDHFGIKDVLDKALKALDPTGTRPIHVSFDIDAMDPTLTPSTGTPVVGGLSLREMFYIAEEVAKTDRLKMVDIAEVNPKLGTKEDVDKTVKTTLSVIEKFFGNRRRGSYPSDYQIPEAAIRRSSLSKTRADVAAKLKLGINGTFEKTENLVEISNGF